MTYEQCQEGTEHGTRGEAAAYQILIVLGGRKGFDWWWHDIDAECKEEIFQQIVREVEGALE